MEDLHEGIPWTRWPPWSDWWQHRRRPHDAALAIADYTILNVLHAAMDEDVTDMILSCHQTEC
jgi:hypothetical protein